MVESTSKQKRILLGVGSVQNGCLLTFDQDGQFDPEADWNELAPIKFIKPKE